jgi:glutamate carboxypeptidase
MPSDQGQRMLEWVLSQRSAFLSFLKQLTLAESPSSDPQSHGWIRAILGEALAEQGLETLCPRGHGVGHHLYARPRPRPRGGAAQLLLGHVDTVWPRGTLREMAFHVEGDLVKGPGVFDMKGGIAQMVFALKAIRDLGLEMPLTPLVFLNSDEELGSPDSSRWIRVLARRVRRVFVLEPAMGPGGRIKTARKGVARYTVVVRGRAAHAGLDPEAGASAILELSYVIQRLFALNDPERGVTVNVGTVDGGLRPNVIAPRSQAVVDVRVRSQEDARRLEQAILAIRPATQGVSLSIEGGIGRPAMEPTPRNQALWEQAKGLGRELGLELEEAAAGGGSDGNTTSQYTATLDGLGPVGDGAHAHHEHLDLSRTLERTALLALLLCSPP